jgi:RHS repeat-associated protein
MQHEFESRTCRTSGETAEFLDGNQVSQGSDSFSWDHENRLTDATIDSTTWSHEYNGDGVRMSRSDGTTTVDYVWDVASKLPMLLQDGTNTYVYGLGLVSTYDGSEMIYRLVDGLGSTVNLCNEDGDLVGSYYYDAYGNVRVQSGSETEFSFTGEQNDPNGLDFLRARYYDSETGRFLSGDPLGGGYGYAYGNPTNLVDPSGLIPAGTCLTFDNTAHVWVGCGAADQSALVGDTWYNDYLTESASNGVSDTAVVSAQLAIVAPKVAPTPPTSSVASQTQTPSEAAFQVEAQQATGIFQPPNTGNAGLSCELEGRDCPSHIFGTPCLGVEDINCDGIVDPMEEVIFIQSLYYQDLLTSPLCSFSQPGCETAICLANPLDCDLPGINDFNPYDHQP